MARTHAVAAALLLASCATSPGGVDVEAAKRYLDRGKSAAGKGEHTAAVDYFGQALEANPQFPEAYYERGRSRVHLRRDRETAGDVRAHEEQAYRDYSMAIQYNPGYADAYYNRAMLLSSRAQYKQAAEDLINACRFSPNDDQAHYYLAWIYEKYFEEKIDAAMGHYEKYLQLAGAKGDPEVRRKVEIWKQIRPALAPPPAAKTPGPEDEEKAVKLHQEAIDLLKAGKRDEVVKVVETLLREYGHTKYVREKASLLETMLGAFKK